MSFMLQYVVHVMTFMSFMSSYDVMSFMSSYDVMSFMLCRSCYVMTFMSDMTFMSSSDMNVVI